MTPAAARQWIRVWLAAIAIAVSAAACSDGAGEPESDHVLPVPHVEARLPTPGGSFAHSRTEVSEPRISGAELADVERCAPCHQAVVDDFQKSAHRAASFDNPLYRVSVEGFRTAQGNEASQFCAGCHDPALLVDGAMLEAVDPEDPRSRAGITCSVCHGIEEVRPGGNGSYRLAAGSIALPDMTDPESILLHRRSARKPALDEPGFCNACHQANLGPGQGHPHFLPGADDASPHRRSAYAGSHATRVDDPMAKHQCRDCHMAAEVRGGSDASLADGVLPSHRFDGGHSMLAAMRRDSEAMERIEAVLRGAAELHLSRVQLMGEHGEQQPWRQPRAGDRLQFDLVVFNDGTGHLFPGGTADLADTWIEIQVTDSAGRLVAEAGTEQQASGRDPTAHRLHAELIDDDGHAVLEHQADQFRAVAYNSGVAARDSRVVGFEMRVPPGSQLPLTVQAKLRYRARSLAFLRAACHAQQTKEGQRFLALGGMDACVSAPVTLIGSVMRTLEAEPIEPQDSVGWLLYGQGLAHAQGDLLESSRTALERAYGAAQGDGDSLRMARAATLLGGVHGKLGRTDDALGWFEHAEALVGEHPAVDAARGRAYLAAWQFEPAVQALGRAAAGAPTDDLLAADLAFAAASAGHVDTALRAAQQGLAWSPTQAGSLRSQAFALRKLLPDSEDTRLAERAYLAHRPFDDAPGLRSRCATQSAECRLEQIPVHVHVMRQADEVP